MSKPFIYLSGESVNTLQNRSQSIQLKYRDNGYLATIKAYVGRSKYLFRLFYE